MGHWKDAYLTASIDEANAAFPDFVSALFEIVEFTRIHEALQDVPPRELTSVIDKLKKAVNGPVDVANETPKSTAARNFLFEASVAAMAHRPARNVEAILNARSDTGIKIEGRKIWVECKRVTSEHALEGNPIEVAKPYDRTSPCDVDGGVTYQVEGARDTCTVDHLGQRMHASAPAMHCCSVAPWHCAALPSNGGALAQRPLLRTPGILVHMHSRVGSSTWTKRALLRPSACAMVPRRA
ncbi:MAG: hypothetical protein K2Q97_17610 [Burkholderiaceae bacterium]|nr:hypothetical protein [Burkholderiaceae bacterium]